MKHLMVLLHLGAAASAAATLPVAARVDDILDRYAATVETSLRSFAVTGEFTMDTRWKRVPTPNVKPGRYILHVERDFRYDGRRIRSIGRKWGDVGFRRIPKENPIINSSIIDTDFRASYSGQRGKPTIIKYFKEPLDAEIVRQRLDSQWIGAAAFGFFASEQRIDTILRQCDNAAVRRQTERVNGSSCYVIDADTEQGRFTVWIDPNHGYHMAKARAVQEQGDRVHGRLLPEGHKVVDVLTNVKFREIDGVWIPVESIYEASVVHPPNMEMRGRTHSKITEFLIDPDHEALRSFGIDDFPEGQRVAYFENGQLDPNRYVWKHGEPVPADR